MYVARVIEGTMPLTVECVGGLMNTVKFVPRSAGSSGGGHGGAQHGAHLGGRHGEFHPKTTASTCVTCTLSVESVPDQSAV